MLSELIIDPTKPSPYLERVQHAQRGVATTLPLTPEAALNAGLITDCETIDVIEVKGLE